MVLCAITDWNCPFYFLPSVSLAFKSELLEPMCHVSYEKKRNNHSRYKTDVAVFNCIVHSDKRKLTSKPERSSFLWVLLRRDRDRDILARLRFGHRRPVNRGCPIVRFRGSLWQVTQPFPEIGQWPYWIFKCLAQSLTSGLFLDLAVVQTSPNTK